MLGWDHSSSVGGSGHHASAQSEHCSPTLQLPSPLTDLLLLCAALRAESRGRAQARLGAQLQRGGPRGQAAQLHGGRAHQDAAHLHPARDPRLRRQPETRTGAFSLKQMPAQSSGHASDVKVSCSAASRWLSSSRRCPPSRFLSHWSVPATGDENR